MELKYNIDVNNETIIDNLTRIGNQIFKLLPMREEGQNWEKPLETLLVELAGLASLMNNESGMLMLLSKLEGLNVKQDQINFMLYRRIIFECCGLIDKIKGGLNVSSDPHS